MPWCPKFKLKYRKEFDTCSDCKVQLVDNLQNINNRNNNSELEGFSGEYIDLYEEYTIEEIKDLKALQEWQEHQYDPGYYIGTGQVPKPIASLSGLPFLLISSGIILIGYVILNLALNGININLILANIVPFLLGIILLICGIQKQSSDLPA